MTDVTRPSTAQRAFSARARGSLRRRKTVNALMVGLIVAAAVLATVPLIVISF
jgi:hypothetical protein